MRIRLLFGSLVLLASALFGQPNDVCAIRVSVSWDDGTQVSDRPAVLVDAHGKTVQKTIVRNGQAEFCDFDFGPHSILVGGESCGAAEIKNIRAVYGQTQTLRMTLHYCPGGGDSSGNACFFNLRVRSDGGRPLPSVVVVDAKNEERTVTDKYGRSSLPVFVGPGEIFMLSKAGFGKKALNLSCRTPGSRDLPVVLMELK